MPFLGLSGGQTLPTPPSPPAPTGASSLAGHADDAAARSRRSSSTWDRNASANAWMFFTLSGLASPGTIPRGGIKGFKRETGWDIKKGKGTAGRARSRSRTSRRARGTITVQLLTAQDFTDWDNFVSQVLAIPEQNQQANGLVDLSPELRQHRPYHRGGEHFTGPEEQRPGLYYCTMSSSSGALPPRSRSLPPSRRRRRSNQSRHRSRHLKTRD